MIKNIVPFLYKRFLDTVASKKRYTRIKISIRLQTYFNTWDFFFSFALKIQNITINKALPQKQKKSNSVNFTRTNIYYSKKLNSRY